MSSTPQTTTPASKGPVEIREIKGQVAADVEQIDTEKRTKKPLEDSLGQSRSSLSRLNPPQHIDMPCSTDSIRPLTAASENTRIEKPPVKPEPIYTRAALSHYDSEKQEYHNQPGLAASFTPTHWSVASPGQPSTINTEACNCEYVRIQYVPSEQKPPSEDHFGLILVSGLKYTCAHVKSRANFRRSTSHSCLHWSPACSACTLSPPPSSCHCLRLYLSVLASNRARGRSSLQFLPQCDYNCASSMPSPSPQRPTRQAISPVPPSWHPSTPLSLLSQHG